MITTKTVLTYDYMPSTNGVSLHTDTLYYDDGKYVGTKRHTESFVPGKIDKMKTYLQDQNHPIPAYIDTLWTPDIIAKQQAADAAAFVEISKGNEPGDISSEPTI